MTTNELIEYYQNLLILQYVEQPNAYATIGVLAALPIADQLPLAVQNAFNINPTLGPTAIGTQLDTIGKYVGVTRYGYDINGNPLTLSDTDFTLLIQIAAIRNFAGSSLADIQTLLHEYFANEIFVYDYANMQMSYLISSSVGDQALVEMIVQQNLLPKPMGVQLATVIYIDQPSLFGFLSYQFSAPTWDNVTIYALNQEVYYQGIVYTSLVANNVGNAVTNTTYWEPLIYPFNNYSTYPTYEPYTWLTYSAGINIV